jgi:hypothetical protein
MSNESTSDPDSNEPPERSAVEKYLRATLNIAGGSIPLFGGLLSATAGFWSESEQDEINKFIRAQIKMMLDEMREKYRVLAEVIIRLDMHDEEIKKRIRSDEYQAILKKAFRNWAGTESRKKQEYVRNLLSNAAATKFVSDDVVMLFLEWLNQYSEFHFSVIAEIYKAPGITRAGIWDELGKGDVREDSAEADLFKLLVRDLSTGGVIRQHRETDYQGNFLARRAPPPKKGTASRVMKSAFDDKERYELTAIGEQFIHYVMTELVPKVAYQEPDDDEAVATDNINQETESE